MQELQPENRAPTAMLLIISVTMGGGPKGTRAGARNPLNEAQMFAGLNHLLKLN